MKKTKNMMVTGMVVAAVLVAGISVYAAGDVVESTVDKVVENFGGHRGGMNPRGQSSHVFETAVEEGILTQEEADAILAHQEANQADREAIKEATEGLTREEAKTYMEENYPRTDLVEAGLLTQEQADALEALQADQRELRQGRQGKGEKGGMGFTAALEAGILDAADVEAIEAYQEANRPDMEALKAELDGLTREEAKAYMEENYPRTDLVEAGLLTQEQVDALEALRADCPERTEMDGERSEIKGERPEGTNGRDGMRGQGRGMTPATEGIVEDSSL